MSGKHGFYSDVIVYDEKTRYYYMWAQKNKPLLDDEIRNMGIGLLDQVRRGIQHVYGDVAVPTNKFSGFFSTGSSFKVQQASDIHSNFIVKGGASLDKPAVLYAKGFYIFLTKDIEYRMQNYSSEDIDLNYETDKTLTLSPIPTISEPNSNRIDIVYISLHFNEVTAVNGSDTEVYKDSNLKNPIVGTETANRLRAVFDVRVRENWTAPIDKNIFEHIDFLGSVSEDSACPTSNIYNIPIAAIYREAHSDIILDTQIIDLLTLYSKRVDSLEEISYKISHGGYSQENIRDKGLTGFSAQFPFGKIDEGAFATGLNQGLSTEAYNSNSVTPRVLDNYGKFMVKSLMADNNPNVVTQETGPEALNPGEIVAKQISAYQVMVGYGETGITGIREYRDTAAIVARGETGKNIVSVSNYDGETGSITVLVQGIGQGQQENFIAVDHKGKLGLNTKTPGHEAPEAVWNTERYNDGLMGETGVNVIQEINGSAQVDEHLFVKKDLYSERDTFGRTWKIPENISTETPMLIGFTGIPQKSGLEGSAANVVLKRGIAIYGETGIDAYGYTGGQVAIEAYDAEGTRLFTIGDLGANYDKDIKTVYGTGTITAFMSDESLLSIPEYGTLHVGDIVSYAVRLENGDIVSGSKTLTSPGWEGIEEVRKDIINNIGFPSDPTQGYTGVPYSRTYEYDYYYEVPFDETGIGGYTTCIGTAYGVQIVEDPWGYTGFQGETGMQHGRIILKDLVNGEDPIKIEAIDSFTIQRDALPEVAIDFTSFHYYGSCAYGGEYQKAKFAKLDLGEAADGWLINGDVYFNGNGLLNRVTFSPNAIFKDDIFVYGTIYSTKQVFDIASVQSLTVNNNLDVYKKGYFKEGASFGKDSNVVYESIRANDNNINLYVKGKGVLDEIVARGTDSSTYLMGTQNFTNSKDSNVSANIGGIQGSSIQPFGLHIIDNRNVISTDKYNSFIIDFSDGRGNYSEALLSIKGDLSVDRYLKTQYLSIGSDTIDTDYKLRVNGRTLINDVLEVKALRFIGAEAPEEAQSITDPSNITVIGKINNSSNKEEYQNNQIILREKKFTSTKRIYLNNESNLGAVETEPQSYYVNNILPSFTGSTPIKARWALDNVSYTEDQFDEIITTTDEIIVEDITIEGYKKFNCERIRVASLGSLMIEWSGYKYDPSINVSAYNCIQKYYFTSPYFRNRDGGINVDWYPEENRFGDDNFVVHVRADFIDTNTVIPSIYSIDKSIGLYIPKSKWWQYVSNPDSNGYKSYAIFNPYENVLGDFNCLGIDRQNSSGTELLNWKLALFPRLIRQNRSNVGTNLDKIYTGEWSLDLCLIPSAIGKIANLTGKIEISYYQS